MIGYGADQIMTAGPPSAQDTSMQDQILRIDRRRAELSETVAAALHDVADITMVLHRGDLWRIGISAFIAGAALFGVALVVVNGVLI